MNIANRVYNHYKCTKCEYKVKYAKMPISQPPKFAWCSNCKDYTCVPDHDPA